MKQLLTILIVLFSLGATAQTIVPDPMGNDRCSCAEIVPQSIPWLTTGAEVAYLCAQVNNWNLDTVVYANFFFEVRNYTDDSTVFYTRLCTPDLPNSGNVRIGVTSSMTMAAVRTYLFSTLFAMLNITWE
jgi:hypothetical protein